MSVTIDGTLGIDKVVEQTVKTSQLDYDIGSLGFRNKIINGNFDIWQRGISQTSSGYGSADRWQNINSGTTKTASRQTFTLGQTEVPGNPKYFFRTVVSSATGSANYCQFAQLIEDVSTLSGKTVTLSFYAKADSTKNIAIDFTQSFGTGGSPSAVVSGIGAQLIQLTSSWQRYEVTVDIPSISGKILGTSSDDHLRLKFWFDSGSDYNSQSSSLGQQSGTFDIAQVQLEEGSVATEFESRDTGTELDLCLRYYQKAGFFYRGYHVATGYARETTFLPSYMRSNPSIIISSVSENTNLSFVEFAVGRGYLSGLFRHGTTGEAYYTCTVSLDAEL